MASKRKYDKFVKNLGDMVMCPVCMDTFVAPKILPCQHVFCMDCILNLIDRRCPVCRMHFSYPRNDPLQLPDCLHAKNLMDELNALQGEDKEGSHCSKLKLPPLSAKEEPKLKKKYLIKLDSTEMSPRDHRTPAAAAAVEDADLSTSWPLADTGDRPGLRHGSPTADVAAVAADPAMFEHPQPRRSRGHRGILIYRRSDREHQPAGLPDDANQGDDPIRRSASDELQLAMNSRSRERRRRRHVRTNMMQLMHTRFEDLQSRLRGNRVVGREGGENRPTFEDAAMDDDYFPVLPRLPRRRRGRFEFAPRPEPLDTDSDFRTPGHGVGEGEFERLDHLPRIRIRSRHSPSNAIRVRLSEMRLSNSSDEVDDSRGMFYYENMRKEIRKFLK